MKALSPFFPVAARGGLPENQPAQNRKLFLIFIVSLLLTLWQTAAFAQLDFKAAVNYGTGAKPHGVAAADFNLDGKPDIGTANFGSNNVSVLLGNTNGTFGNAANFGVSHLPFDVVAADFNGDGKPDMAAASAGDHTISVLLGNGNGTFGGRADFAAGTTPQFLTTADFNGDGNPDIVVNNQTASRVAVLLGNGDGTFGNPSFLAVGQTPFGVTAADFNGDGKPDIAAANVNSHNVSVLLGNGDGTFDGPTDFAAGTTPQFLTTADFNDDGKLDIVVNNQTANRVAVLLGNGNGTFSNPSFFAVGQAPRGVAVADFNGDGKPDIATANAWSNDVSVLLGNNHGTFSNAVNLAVGQVPFALTATDFNDDGKLDIVASNNNSNNISVLINNSTPCPAAPVITSQPVATAVCAGRPASFTVKNSGSGSYQWRKNGENIPGATAATYQIGAATAADAGSYSVVFTDGCSQSVTSNAAALTINTLPAITTQPVNATTCAGSGDASFSVAASGTPAPAVQWQYSTDGGSSFSNIGRNESTIFLTWNVVPSGTKFRAILTNSCGSVTSDVVTLTVNPATAITAQPVAFRACAGEAARFGVAVAGTGLSYQWKKNGTAIPGATGSTYVIASVSGPDAADYSVVVSGTCGPAVTSNAVALTVNTKPVITLPAIAPTLSDADKCGATVPFAATVAGSPAAEISYKIADQAITSPYFFEVGVTTVTVTATNDCGTDTKSFAVTIKDNTPPAVVVKNTTLYLNAGGQASLSLADIKVSSSDNCSIQSELLSKTQFTCADLGDNAVKLTVTDANGKVTEEIATVTVIGTIPTPTIAVKPTSKVYTGGNPHVIYLGYGPQSVELRASGGVSYQWSPASGLNNATIANPMFTPTRAGSYTFTVEATSSSGCSATNSVTITVIDVRSDSKKNQVLVCHNGSKLSINPISVQDHLAHGDQLGSCSASVPAIAGSRIYTPEAEVAVAPVLKNYPNPFSGQTTIAFSLAHDEEYTLAIYDLNGTLVKQLPGGKVKANELKRITWQAANAPAGLYLVRLTTATSVQQLKLLKE